MKDFNKKLKLNKKFFCAIALVLVLGVTSLIAGISGFLSRNGITSKNAKMQINEITESDYDTDSDNVKFMAYFLRDNKEVDGTSNRIGYSDTLYFYLKMSEGTLQNAKIQIGSQNFYLETNLMQDNIISQDYVSKNTKEIDLANISGNIDRTFSASVKSGDYEFPTSISDAIGNDVSNYNKESIITFTANYRDNSGKDITINKEIPISVSWYGNVNIEIPEEVYGNDNLIQKYTLSDYLDSENQEMTLEFNVATQETQNEVLLKESYIEGTIPLINNIAPTKVEIEGENVSYTYDNSSRKFTANRTIKTDGDIITEQAYSGIYSQNEVNYRYNEYKVKITYPIDAYLTDDDEFINIDIPVTAHYVGVNEEKSNDDSANINVSYSNLNNEETGFDVSVGRKVLYPEERQVVSKHNILLGYKYNNGSTNLWETYVDKWNIVTNREETANNIVLTDNSTEDKIIKNDGTEINNNGYITNTGIAFTNPVSALGLDGWIKVYNDETDELLHTFTKDDWANYDMYNPYEYGKDVKYIRIETSEVSENSFMIIYNIKRINSQTLIRDFTEQDVKNMQYIQTSFNGTMSVNGEVRNLNKTAKASFEEEISVVNFNLSNGNITTQGSNNIQLEISPNMTQYNTNTWKNEEYLIKFPSDVIDIKLNNLTKNNMGDSTVSDYYTYKEGNSSFIKIQMNGETTSNYQLLLDCTIQTDPNTESKTDNIELYAYNENSNLFYSTDISKDIFDINNNANTEEEVCKKLEAVNIVKPTTLLSNESTSNASTNGVTIYNPLVAMIENNNRTATVDIDLNNNNANPITDIKVLGKIPYEGNKYQESGENLNSAFTAQMVSNGIRIPDEVARRATIYYSEEEEVSEDPQDVNSGWVENVSDFSNVKNFLILFNSYEIQPNEDLKISYDIKIPDDVQYNEIAYSTHTVYYSEHNGSEVERKTYEVNKLGFNVTRRFNFELTQFSRQNNQPIEGISYRVSEVGNRLNNIVIKTNAEGKINIQNLLLEKEYTIQEIEVPDEYVINENLIKFRAYEQNGEIKISITGGFAEEPTIDQENSLVSVKLYNEVKYDLNLTNYNMNFEGIASTYTIEGKGETQEASTNESGNLIFENLYPDVEYTLKQTYSKGYYIETGKEIKFKISRGENGFEIAEDTSGLMSLQTETGKIKPTANITIRSEKIPTYNLKVVLYEDGTIIPLEDSSYVITGGGKEQGETYTTDIKGTFTINDLYAYVDGKNETAEYTLKQTKPTTGYATSQVPIKFVVTKDQNTHALSLSVLEGSIREDYSIEGNTVTISLNARKLFHITTVDGETTTLLPGVKVIIQESVIENNEEVYKDPTDEYGKVLGTEEIIDGQSYRVFTTNENGEIDEPLKDGIYRLIKIEVPEGYHLEEDINDRTYFIGIGETRGASVDVTFRDPTYVNGIMSSTDPSDYYVAGRDDGIGLFYHRGKLSLMDEESQEIKSINSDAVSQIIDDKGTFVVLEDDRIVKYNDNLNAITEYDLPNGMDTFAATPDGGYVVIGTFTGTKTINSNYTASGSSLSITSVKTSNGWFASNTQDIFVMKLNAEGKVENITSVGGTGTDMVTFVTVTTEGDYVVSSHMTSTSISGNMMSDGNQVSGNFADCYFIIDKDTMKVNQIVSVGTSRGNVQADQGNVHRAFAGNDGGVYYVGQMSGTINFSASQTESGNPITVTSTGDTDAYLAKFNNDGKVVWAISVGGTNTDHIYSAEYTPDGELLIGGDSDGGAITVDGSKTSSGFDIVSEPVGDEADTWRGIAIKVDKQGRVVWTNEFGYSSNEGIYAFAGFTGNSYVICGFDTINGVRTDAYIRVDEAEKRAEISEVEGLEIPSSIEKYNIKTSVNGEGGTITGQDSDSVETVRHGENSTSDIVVTPNDGYEILDILVNGEKIPFTPDENGTVTLDKFENVTQDINIVAEFSNNTSKVIVHHYLLGSEDTKVAEDDVLVGTVGTEYTTGPKIGLTGYKLAEQDGEYVITGETSGRFDERDKEVIYYYVEQPVKVTVNYFIEGTTIPLSDTVETEYRRGQTYTTNAATDIPEEYELVKMPENATGVINESEIVVTYYYKLKPTYEYQIQYYFDGNLDSFLTEFGEAIEGKVIDSYTDKRKEGYVFDKVENIPLTVSTISNNNIIKVYYKSREDLSYKIQYYYNGVLDESKTENVNNVKFGTVISEFTDKVIEGYQFDRTENYPLTVGVNAEDNVIKVYYTFRQDLYYKVNYLEQGTNTKLADTKEVGSNTYNSTVTEQPIEIEGYNVVNNNPQSIVIGVNEEENVINFYYTKRNDLSYTVKYLEEGSNEEIANQKVVENKTYEESVTERAIEIPGYNAIAPTEATITIDVGTNEIIFYYQKKTDIRYTVEYYYDGILNSNNTETNTATFESTIENYTDKNITGYKLEKTENLPLTISANESDNVIKVYYVKDTFEYTIEYYYDGVINSENTEKHTAKYGDVIENYTDKNITGYKLAGTENLPLTVSENPENNIIKINYVKDVFGYTVEYYYDGEIDSSKTETIEATFGDVIESYTDKNITGYKLEKTENLPLTVSENQDNNVIKVYYIRDTFDYTTEYYYDGVLNPDNTETLTATYGDSITTYPDKNITGYRLDRTENLPLTVSENPANNVIKIYYVKDTFNYTVEYYYDGVINPDNTETLSATYQDGITTYPDKNITGYRVDRTENLPLTITENPANNVIKVYYVKDTFNYTVEYYYDGNVDNDKTETLSATYKDSITTYTDKNITGYKLEKTENLPLTITENPANNVIKVYYVKDTFNYTVEYYYDGNIDNDKTETLSATYQDSITTYPDKNITGYRLDKTENLPLTVSENSANNVIKVYYVKDTFNYTVEYYYNGGIDRTKTETLSATYGDSITTYTDKNITGYKLEKTENLPLTITENPANNVIKVYYTKDTFNYTVEYYYDGNIDNDKTETLSATYQDTITTYPDKNITGYKLEKTENLPLTITENPANNVIKVYYTKDTFNYTVEYYYDGNLDSTKTETLSATYKDSISTYTDKNITGYRLDRTENLPLTITENPANNVIKLYYVRDTFNYTVEYYYDGNLDNTKTETLSATYGDSISTYPDKNIAGYKLEKTENLPLLITENPENNVMKVYYVKDTFEYTIEYYYDGVINPDNTERHIATYGDSITTYTDKNITGYKLSGTENLPLTVSENPENNIIKVYYVKDVFGYTIEYYYDGNKDASKTETIEATFGDVITTYPDKNLIGYKFDKTENLPLTVSENKDNNVIKVYYVRDTFNYTVEYYYDGQIDSAKTETIQATYGDQIGTYTDKVEYGYRLDKAEPLPLEVSENVNNNVIRVYYVRKDTKVTVKYLEKDTNKVLDENANYEITGKVFDKYTTEEKQFTGYNLVANTNNTSGEMTEEPIEVIYYYELKTPYLSNEEISKNATPMIENLDSEITYNISYRVNLQDYMGKAFIKIVDTLPFAIDTTKSSLDGGEYDSTNNTITWNENVENISSYENKNNEIEINKTIKVVYLGLVQGTTSIENQVSANIKTELPEKEFEPRKATAVTTTGFTVNIPVSKVWEDDNNKLGQRPTRVIFKLTGSDGSQRTIEMAKPGTTNTTTTQDSNNPNKWNDVFENLPKYDVNRQEIVYTLTEEEKNVGDLKYYDSLVTDKTVTNTNKYGKVTVHHYIMNVDGTTTTNRVPDSNNNEIPDEIIEGKEGTSYETKSAQNINEKYELVQDKLPESPNGIIEKYNEEKPQEVIYYYRLKPAKVIVHYLEKDTDQILSSNEQIDGHVDDRYNTDEGHKKDTIEKDGRKYTLVSDSENTEGTMTVADTNVTYYYLQNTKATVRYVARDPETGKIVKDLEDPTTKEGLVGDEFVTNAKAFIGYKLVESPEHTTIKMTKEEQTLIYYYEPVYTGLIENHIDEQTGRVLNTEEHEVQVGQNYNIPSKEFAGYDLVESKLPNNATGIMGEDLVTVNYYYIKKAELEVNYIDKLTGEPLTGKIVDNTKHEGDSYTTEEKTFENYDLVELPSNKGGTMEVETDENGNITNNKTVVTYYYIRKAVVEEHHIDVLTNEDIEEPTIHNGHVGDEYTTSSKEFLSYQVVEDKLPENATGEMTVNKIVVNYYYNQPAKVVVHYVDKTTGKELEEANEETGELQSSQVVIEGQNKDKYETTEKEFKYYKLVESPAEPNGEMKVEITKDKDGKDVVNNTIDVYYYYEPKEFNIGVEKEVSGIIVNGERGEATNGKLEKVDIYRKSTENTSVQVEYKIKVKNTGEVEGRVTVEDKIPEGMSLANNDGTWEEEDGVLRKVIPEIGAGETKEYTVLLNWNTSGNNMGEKTNEVALVETDNVPGFKDNNDKDNTDEATTLISVETGEFPTGLLIVLIGLVVLESVTLRYAGILTKRQKKNNKKIQKKVNKK